MIRLWHPLKSKSTDFKYFLQFHLQVVLREHVRAHHSGPDPKCHNSLTPYMCKVCGDTLPTSDELVAHIVAHCDENTAMRRQPQSGPRKYKRRRKLKNDSTASLTTSRVNESFDMLDGPSDSDENTKRKLGKKTKRSNVEEGYQNVLKSFESSLQNINSIVSNSKTHPTKTKAGKKKVKKDDKKGATAAAVGAEPPSSNHPGRPKMIHTQKTRVPVEMGTDGVKKGQKTKTMVTRTPKVMPNDQQRVPGAPTGGERNRPRTKNVSYHVEGRQQFIPATFAKPKVDDLIRESVEVSTIEMVNIKVEPGLQKVNANQNHASNNNGNLVDFVESKQEKEKTPVKRRGSVKKTKRRTAAATRKSKEAAAAAVAAAAAASAATITPVMESSIDQSIEEIVRQQDHHPQHDLLMHEPLQEQVHQQVQPTQLFESVVDGNNLEVAFEANIMTEPDDMVQESILPDLDKVNHVEEISSGDASNVKLSVKVESAPDGMLDVHSLIGSVEESVPETIIPDAVEYTCEMCAAVFTTRADLLVHVPVHI